MKGYKEGSKPKIVYYYDALCGWCFGFNSVISQLVERYGSEIVFELTSGGLFTGNRVGLINDVAPYIKAGAYKDVERTTGVKFGARFLEKLQNNERFVMDSLAPAIALCIIKEIYPERQVEFGEVLLKAIYFDGVSPDDLSALGDCAIKFGLDRVDFFTKMKDLKYKRMAEKEFTSFQESGFTGMPTLVLINEGEHTLLSSGYNSFDNIGLKLDSLLISDESRKG